jgi:hypothetical protein
VRVALVAAAALLLGAILLVAVGANSSAPAPTCAVDMDEAACQGAVSAVVRRGLPTLHPLILATRVAPGSSPGPQDLGHRATVEFDLLGMLSPLSIELYYDAGAHWGGRADHSEDEVAAWALAPIALAALIAIGLLVFAWWRRPRATG